MNRLRNVNRKPHYGERLFNQPTSPNRPQDSTLRKKTCNNPSSIATCGLFVAFGTLTCQLLFAQDTVRIDSAMIPAHLLFGGILITLGGALELCLGHVLSAVALVTLGLFCFPFNKTLLPVLSAISQGTTAQDSIPPTVEMDTRFEASAIILGMILLVCLVSSFRTNVALVLTIFSLDLGVCLAAGAYWLSRGHSAGGAELGKGMVVDAAVCFVVASGCSCWIFFSTLLEAVDFPSLLPTGNLSGPLVRTKAK